MTKNLCLVPIVIAALALAACQGAGIGLSDNDIAGIYYLVTVDGAAVPGPVTHDGTTMHMHSGTFIISNDGTCFSRTEFTPPGHARTTREVHALYRVEDSRLIMQWEGAGTTEGTVEGDIFVMDNHGMIFEYSRGG